MSAKYPKIMCSVRLEQEQVQMIDAYIRNQRLQPSFSDVVRISLQRFLREKMYDLE
jgi:Arc/MetJ-type ribon-helix-helix transcriptional regulator